MYKNTKIKIDHDRKINKKKEKKSRKTKLVPDYHQITIV